jgi:hypothetical protein
VTLIIRCANGVVIWIARRDGQGAGTIRCMRDGVAYPLSVTADRTWEDALRDVLTHSVQLAGQFQNMWVLPTHF